VAYGVKIPGRDGRAGMVAVTVKPGKAFDPPSFYKLCAHFARNEAELTPVVV